LIVKLGKWSARCCDNIPYEHWPLGELFAMHLWGSPWPLGCLWRYTSCTRGSSVGEKRDHWSSSGYFGHTLKPVVLTRKSFENNPQVRPCVLYTHSQILIKPGIESSALRGVQTPDSHLNSITDLMNYLRGEEDAEKRRQCAIHGPYVLVQTSFRS